MKCTTEGCEKEAKTKKTKLCGTCYQRSWRIRTGRSKPPAPKAEPPKCVVEWCKRRGWQPHGYCSHHKSQLKRFGEVRGRVGGAWRGKRCFLCITDAAHSGVNGPLCLRHYNTERKRLRRGMSPLSVDTELREVGTIPKDERCFVCERPANRHGVHVYLCSTHYRNEWHRIERGAPVFGTADDTPIGFRGPPKTTEAEDEAKIDAILAARQVLLDDREKHRIEPWARRESLLG